MTNYDNWLTHNPADDRLADWERHFESCAYCQYLDSHGWEPDAECEECFHPAHSGTCDVERGDHEGNEGEVAIARGPCPCDLNNRLSVVAIEKLQSKCWADTSDRLHDEADERRYREWADEVYNHVHRDTSKDNED